MEGKANQPQNVTGTCSHLGPAACANLGSKTWMSPVWTSGRRQVLSDRPGELKTDARS